MKIINFHRFFLLLFSSISLLASHELSCKPALNSLERIEISRNKVCVQFLFDFAKTAHITPRFDEKTGTLSLLVNGMMPHQFHTNKNWSQLEALRRDGILDSIMLEEPAAQPQCTLMTLAFAKTLKLKDGTEIPNELLLKWGIIKKQGTRLFLSTFFKRSFKNYKKSGSHILLATNDVIQNDFSQAVGLPLKKTPGDFRILIDAGHGGKDLGAIGYGGAKEKEIALSVSQKVHDKLSALGYKAHLTRNADKTLSLVQRSNLANQVKAHAVVSVHVNSSQHACSYHAGKSTKPTGSGIETFFLDEAGLLPPSLRGGYYFVNTVHDQNLIDKANTYTQEKISGSKSLASLVQNNILSNLRKNGMTPKDRGIKPEHLRLILHNAAPTALAEIGFITDKDEATRLQSEKYQDMIAQGIVQGVHKYFAQQ